MTSSNSLRGDAHSRLAAHRGLLERTSRTTRVAGILREEIIDGTFRPGARLSEPDICAALDVSRNTVREAFQILIEDRLVAHELNRGVFVRVPTAEDITELYICRRVVECAGVNGFRSRDRRPVPGRRGPRSRRRAPRRRGLDRCRHCRHLLPQRPREPQQQQPHRRTDAQRVE